MKQKLRTCYRCLMSYVAVCAWDVGNERIMSNRQTALQTKYQTD